MHPLATLLARRRRPAHTTILAQRRGPPSFVLVPLFVGFFLAVAVDRALGEPSSAPLGALEPDAPVAATGRALPAESPPVTPVPVAPRVVVGEPILRPHRKEPAAAPEARNAALERTLKKVLADGKTPYAATVLLEVGSGRVLAVAEHSTLGPAEGLARKPMAPAASVFKIVTSSALLRRGVPAGERVCARGGMRRLSDKLLIDDPKRDHACTTLFDTLPLSQNTALAKLALKHLDPEALRDEARRFGFDGALPVDGAPALEASPARIPDDPFGFAEAASGFGEVKLSALHGAVLASIVATGGVLVPPRLGEGDADGPEARRVVDARHAETLRRMMADTVSEGTARRAFGTGPRLKHSAAGKTGSLTDYQTKLDTSWFVGFAPAERPQVAVATVVVNQGKWHVKAPYVAKEALRAFFAEREREQKAAVVAHR